MDRELLKELYLKYAEEIYRYLYTLSQNSPLAEDLTQETFLKALLSLSESHGNMKAWLYMVARNLYFNHHKKEKTLTPWNEQLAENPAFESAGRLEEKSENNTMLLCALAQLDQQKREVLQLQYFAGFSQNEIAAILRLTPGNVRVLALRAKRELKQYMEANEYDIS